MAAFLQGMWSDTVTGREEFHIGDDNVGFPGNAHLADLLLPYRVVLLSYLGHIAVTGLKCFV